MAVLVVIKTTNYEQHGETVEARAQSGSVSAGVLNRLKSAHDEHYQTLEKLRSCLTKAAISFVELSRDDDFPAGAFDLVITVGGDGTLLAASHRLPAGGRIVGVRSSASSVGYLCAVDCSTLDSFISDYLANKLNFDDVSRVSARLSWADGREDTVTVPVLNDFLFTNVNPAATTRYKIHFHDKSEAQRSSGIWISTGTGSTAGIFAAGGQSYDPLDEKVQFKVREIFTLGLSSATIEHGFFVPGDGSFKIENRCEQAILAIDGQHGAMEVTYGDIIRFEKAAPIGLVRNKLNIKS